MSDPAPFTTGRGRLDARDKASGRTRYVGDVAPDLDCCHVAVVRATHAHARVLSIDASAARALPGVVGVFTAADLSRRPYGRVTEDTPILAGEKVRFVGERVAAVVAERRDLAEQAAALVEVDYEPLGAVLEATEALEPGAPRIHDAPWEYRKSFVRPTDHPNLQSQDAIGDKDAATEALGQATYVVDRTYSTPTVHQGYLEPQASLARVEADGRILLWTTNKAPYALRSVISNCLGLGAGELEIRPAPIGADFGGKGGPQDAVLCVAVAALVRRPVKIVLRYGEDLTSTNPRHGSEIRIRAGCDPDGNLLAVVAETLLDGGAYAGYNPGFQESPSLPGSLDATGYRIPALYAANRIVYTNNVPKGNMRAPGAPQWIFAFESMMDELAQVAGIAPAAFRRRNVLRNGERTAVGHPWLEFRGEEVLDSMAALPEPPAAPAGWLVGRGMSLYSRTTHTHATTSLRLIPTEEGLDVEIGVPETGTGSHTVVRELLAEALGFAPDRIAVRQVSTDGLPIDRGAGGSRVTAVMSAAVGAAALAWKDHDGRSPLVVEVDRHADPFHVGSYVAQVADVAVDPETGELAVLRITTSVDVAGIVNPKAHRMQIDGGTLMGFGYACLEDLDQREGQIWSANLGEFKISSERDTPELVTLLVEGGRGVGVANVKNVGELTTPPTAAAIANAVFAATGCRLTSLPINAERLHRALRAQSQAAGAGSQP